MVVTGKQDHFIVVVPGLYGSKLKNENGEVVWVKKPPLLRVDQYDDYLEFLYKNLKWPNKLYPAGILDRITVVEPWATIGVYDDLFTELATLGYFVEEGHNQNVYSFSYDWRQPVEISAKEFQLAMNGWIKKHPDKKAFIIAHSLGGLVSRWYIEKLNGKSVVDKLVLLGSPTKGAPMAAHVLFGGLEILLSRRFRIPFFSDAFAKVTKDLVRTFPTAYQLLPTYDSIFDNSNNPVDPYDGSRWLFMDDPTDQELARSLLKEGKNFNKNLGRKSSVDTWCVISTIKSTPTRLQVSLGANGRWLKTRLENEVAGDGTVPTVSANLETVGGNFQLVDELHGTLFSNKITIQFLKFYFFDKQNTEAGLGHLAFKATNDLSILFEPRIDGEFVRVLAPNQEFECFVQIGKPDESYQLEQVDFQNPVTNATVEVELVFQDTIFGLDDPEPAPDSIKLTLDSLKKEAGIYSSRVLAPGQEGHYRLVASISIPGKVTESIEELITVEILPGE